MKINCDLGEQEDFWVRDKQIIRHIDQANVACGSHAGNLSLVEKTIAEVKCQGKELGVHPGYADPENFGRVSLILSPLQLKGMLSSQIGNFLEICLRLGVMPQYLKPHGALYHDCKKEEVLHSLLEIMKEFSLKIPVMLMYDPIKKEGFSFLKEGFVDRKYQNQTELVNRKEKGAIHEDIESWYSQYESIVKQHRVRTSIGFWVNLELDSICVHGDSVHTLEFLENINKYTC